MRVAAHVLLTRVLISCNQITELPLSVFGRLFRLDRLIVDGNPLTGVPLAFLQGGAQGKTGRRACDACARAVLFS